MQYYYMMREMPSSERPRERMLRLGADALSDMELLAIVLRTGTRSKSALALAGELLSAHGGNLAGLADCTLRELQQHPGIGPAKAVEIQGAFAVARRIAEERNLERPLLNSPLLICRMMQEKFRGKAQEECHVLMLDTKMRFVKDEAVTAGLLDRSLVHPREVFRPAIRESCKTIIICHNHPSGNPEPSKDDDAITAKLVDAGRIIGIEVLDHIIVGNPSTATSRHNYFSYRENSPKLFQK